MEDIQDTIWDFGSKIFQDGLLAFCLRSAFIVIIAWLVSHLVRRAFKKAIDKTESRTMPLSFLGKIFHFIIWCIAVFAILDGVRPLSGLGTAVLGATSIFSVVVGLAAQETFGNFIAGFFIAIYQPFAVGDVVSLPEKNISGTVIEITFRHTILSTIQNTKLIIPNSVMNSAIIEDRAFGQTTYTRYISFDIGYDSDIDKAIKLIIDTVMNTDGVIDIRTEEEKKQNADPITVRVEEFDASGIRLTFPLHTNDLNSSYLAASNVRRSLLKKFKENDIEIPYNKVEVLKGKDA